MGDTGSIPWLGFPWRRKWLPTLAWKILQTEEPGGLCPWGQKESDMTEWLSLNRRIGFRCQSYLGSRKKYVLELWILFSMLIRIHILLELTHLSQTRKHVIVCMSFHCGSLGPFDSVIDWDHWRELLTSFASSWP